MRLKKFGALFLAGAMMTGTIGVMSQTQAKADTPANTYTMTVPANVDIENSGWNSLGNIQITGSVDSGKKVTVTATTTNNFALKNGDNSVSYTLKKAENDTNATTSFEFDAASIKAEGGASQAIGVDVADFAGKPAGNYTDTITFTGVMSSAGGGSSDTPTASGMFVDGAQVEITTVSIDGETVVVGFIYAEGNGYTCNKVMINGRDNTKPYASMCQATKDGQNFVFVMGGVTLTVDTKNNTYTKSSEIGSLNALLINGTDITNQLTDISDRTSSGGGSSDTPTASDMFVDGAQVEITIDTTYNQTLVIGFKYDEGSGYTCNKVFWDEDDMTSVFAQKYRATKVEQNFVILFDSERLIVDTENNTYKKLGNIASLNALLINGTDIVASLSESVPN